jgi:predicted MFS family arabinose efflux permease
MAMGTVLDSWVMKMTNQGHPVRYNITRGVGSIAFATTSQVFGRVLDVTGMAIIPYVFTGLALLLVFLAAITQPPVHQASEPTKNPFSAMGEIVRNRRFMVLMVALLLSFAGNGAAIVFMPVRMAELGGTNLHVGTAMMVMALSEAPAMLLHHRIVKVIRNDRLLTISIFFFIVKVLLLGFATSPLLLILAQTFQFLSFGLYMPSVIQEINRMVPERQLTTALLVYASLTFGLGIMIGSSLGGILAETLSVQVMFLIMAVGPTLGLFIRMLSGVLCRKSRANALG